MARKLTDFAYGDLNPVLSSNNKPTIDKDEGFFNILKRTAEIVHTPNSMEGIIELRGLVLRAEDDIKDRSQIPEDSWLSDHYFPGGSSLDEPLQAYKVFIPELHAHLPRVRSFTKDHAKIEKYPTFIASNSRIEPASAGQIVRVTFTNMTTQEGPIYLGPIFNKAVGPIEEDKGFSMDHFKPSDDSKNIKKP